MTPPPKIHVAVLIGTRPEAIKLAPVVRELRAQSWATTTVVKTGQHQELLDQALASFNLTFDEALRITRVDHSLAELTSALLTEIDRLLARQTVDVVLVQGDTTTALAGAMAGFYRGIAVGHVEAGLRSGDPTSPFPEEANRRMIAALAAWHFAPTPRAQANLLAEGIPANAVVLTGNTIVDALNWTLSQTPPETSLSFEPGQRLMVVTLHRRESIGAPLDAILRAIRRIARAHPDLIVWFPLHPNPRVRARIEAALADLPRIRLVGATEHGPFLHNLMRADLLLTDSGGAAEEATALGVRTLIARETTERAESIEAGVAELVGTDEETIVARAAALLARPKLTEGAAVFGDGHASARIVAFLRDRFRSRIPGDERGIRIEN